MSSEANSPSINDAATRIKSIAYLSAAGKLSVSPSAFRPLLSAHAETERLFSSYEEDYHISRFLDFLPKTPGLRSRLMDSQRLTFAISAEIQSIL